MAGRWSCCTETYNEEGNIRPSEQGSYTKLLALFLFVILFDEIPCPADDCMVITWRAPSSVIYDQPHFFLDFQKVTQTHSSLSFLIPTSDRNSLQPTTSNQLNPYEKMHNSFGAMVALVATVAAKTIVITAGTGGLAFSPDTVTADVGDVLEYHFVGSIHSAVQGDFSSPCAQSSTGFDSGPVTSVSSSSHS